jgi:UrcA family protein
MNRHDLRTRVIGSVVAFAGTLGLALAAQAGEPGTAPAEKHDDVVVRYADLDLTSAEGAKALYARLSSAAERACGKAPNSRELKARSQYKACFDRTLEKAVGKVGNPSVQALHAVRDGAKVG